MNVKLAQDEIAELTAARDQYRAQVEALQKENAQLLEVLRPVVEQGYVAWAWLEGLIELSIRARYYAAERLREVLRATEEYLPDSVSHLGESALSELRNDIDSELKDAVNIEDKLLLRHLPELLDIARNQADLPSGRTWQQELEEL